MVTNVIRLNGHLSWFFSNQRWDLNFSTSKRIQTTTPNKTKEKKSSPILFGSTGWSNKNIYRCDLLIMVNEIMEILIKNIVFFLFSFIFGCFVFECTKQRQRATDAIKQNTDTFWTYLLSLSPCVRNRRYVYKTVLAPNCLRWWCQWYRHFGDHFSPAFRCAHTHWSLIVYATLLLWNEREKNTENDLRMYLISSNGIKFKYFILF